MISIQPRIQKFDTGGTFLWRSNINGTSSVSGSYLPETAVDSSGNVFQVATSLHKIFKYSTDGTSAKTIGDLMKKNRASSVFLQVLQLIALTLRM